MGSTLKLITTEKFGDLDCDFYRNLNDDVLLTREQVGLALEYSNPAKSIQKIHLAYKNRIEPLCFRQIECRYPKGGGAGVNVETVYYTDRGIMEICRHSRQSKADSFMDWVWDIIHKYRNGELYSNSSINMKPITDTLATLTQAITTLTQNMSDMKNDIDDIKQNQRNRYLLERRYPSAWYRKMAPKYKLLQEYFECSRSELYSSIYKELEDMYDVDINQLFEDYCYENHLLRDECYPMDAIEHDPQLRDALALLINSSLVKYGLQTEEQVKNFKRKTLFDREGENRH